MIWSITVLALSIRSCRSCLELAPNAGPASKKQRQIDEIAFFMWGFLSSSRSIARVCRATPAWQCSFWLRRFWPAHLACRNWSQLEVRVNLKLAIPNTKTGKRKGDLSKFVEEAVRWRVLDKAVSEVKLLNAHVPPAELEAAIDEAVQSVRAERFKPAA